LEWATFRKNAALFNLKHFAYDFSRRKIFHCYTAHKMDFHIVLQKQKENIILFAVREGLLPAILPPHKPRLSQ